jgi:hypothetical protein
LNAKVFLRSREWVTLGTPLTSTAALGEQARSVDRFDRFASSVARVLNIPSWRRVSCQSGVRSAVEIDRDVPRATPVSRYDCSA